MELVLPVERVEPKDEPEDWLPPYWGCLVPFCPVYGLVLPFTVQLLV